LNQLQFAIVELLVFLNITISVKIMAKTLKKSKEKAILKEYQKIVKGIPNNQIAVPIGSQWSNQGDFFTKFSLYKDTRSITSTETSILR
jgi:hypothetical protein